MSWLDTFMGKTKTGGLEDSKIYQGNANTINTSNIKKMMDDTISGYGSAAETRQWGAEAGNAYLQQGGDRARSDLTSGFGQARGDITSGYGQARSDITGGYGTARSDINSSTDKGQGFLQDYLKTATGMLDPYIKSGYSNQTILDNAAGTNGATSQADVYRNFADANNPLTAYRDQLANAQLREAMNARGQSSSGRANLAIARASEQRKADDWQAYLANVQNSAQRGAGMASNAASLTSQTGANLADLEARRGAALGNLSTQQASALSNLSAQQGSALAEIAAREGTSLAEVASRVSALQSQNTNALGADISNLKIAKTNALNNLGMAQNQQTQNYYDNLGSIGQALDAQKNAGAQAGINNLMNLGSMAVKAFSPVPIPLDKLGNPVQTQSMGSNAINWAKNQLWGPNNGGWQTDTYRG